MSKCELTCGHCERPFLRRDSEVKHRARVAPGSPVFCSRKCRYEGLAVALPPTLPAEYVAGSTIAAIAQRYSVSAETVRHRLQRAGVKLRGRADHVRGDRNPTKGKGHSEATRALIREAARRQFATPGAREGAAQRQREAMASGRIAKTSRLESLVAVELDASGHHYVRQAPIRDAASGRFCAVVDFLLADGRAVEVQGGFWHADPRDYPSGPIKLCQVRTVANDRAKREALAANGVPLVEIWEREIRRDPARAVREALA